MIDLLCEVEVGVVQDLRIRLVDNGVIAMAELEGDGSS